MPDHQSGIFKAPSGLLSAASVFALRLSLPSLTRVRLWKPCVKASKWLSSSHVISKSAHFSGVCVLHTRLRFPAYFWYWNILYFTTNVATGSPFSGRRRWDSLCWILPFRPVFVSLTETNDEHVPIGDPVTLNFKSRLWGWTGGILQGPQQEATEGNWIWH